MWSSSPLLSSIGTLGFIIGLYFLPLIVAMARSHRQVIAIGVLNGLAGWTIAGWVAALVWAFVS